MHRHEIPQPPKGYYCAATFQYPKRFVYIAQLPANIILFVFYVRAGLDQDVFHGAARLGPGIFIFMIAVTLSTNFVARLVQREVSRLLGYDTSSFRLLDAFWLGTYTATPGQLQSRRDVLLIAIAPMGLLFLLWIPLLCGLSGFIGDLLFFFLLINSTSTLWDLYFIGWVLRRPAGTLVYRETIHRHLSFELGQPHKGARRNAFSKVESRKQHAQER